MVDLGKITLRCPRCRNTELEYDDEKPRSLKLEVRCARCGHNFRAEDGVDQREVKRRAPMLVENELKKAFKGLKGFKLKL